MVRSAKAATVTTVVRLNDSVDGKHISRGRESKDKDK